jgi:hypothetical protein
MVFSYNAETGAQYARLYADYSNVPENLRLFSYDQNGSDCTNFCSQCVWAAYGGWTPGFDGKTVQENKERIKKVIRMTPLEWYGSLFFAGSNKWCRVVEFHDYTLSVKALGPSSYRIFEGDWQNLSPSIIKKGDIIQLVVVSYAPNRFGHCLYVTQEGDSTDDVKVCCHSYDRQDAPLSEFSNFPEQYTKLRILRFKNASFVK